MSKWLVIVFESKTEDVKVIRRAMEAAGGQIVWIGNRRPLVQVSLPKLEDDPRTSAIRI